MTAPVVVRLGDPEGGWVPRTDAPPVPHAFVQAALRLGLQPPQELLPLADRPILSLRLVDVPGHGNQWCFTSQSIGRAQRLRAGGCDFVFERATDWAPGPFWRHCTAQHYPSPERPGDVTDQVEAVLHRMLDGFPFVGVDGPPEVVAQVIGQLLDVLPVDEVIPRTWWTCLLRFRLAGDHAVTGTWPNDFPADGAQMFDRLLAAPAAPDDHPPLERRDDAVRYLAHLAARRAADPKVPRSHPKQTSLRGLLAEIVANDLDIEAADVPRLYRDERQYNRLDATPATVTAFATAEPDEAWTLLHEVLRTPGITRALFDGIHATEPANRLWSAAGDKAGAITLHNALLLAFGPPCDEALDQGVRRLLVAPGRGLSDRTDRENAGSFLAELGLARDRQPDLFPPRSLLAAEKLRDGSWNAYALVKELRVPGWAGGAYGEAPERFTALEAETLLVARRLETDDVEATAAILEAVLDPTLGSPQPQQPVRLSAGYLDALLDTVGVSDTTTNADGDPAYHDWVARVAEQCPVSVGNQVVLAHLELLAERGEAPSRSLLLAGLESFAAQRGVSVVGHLLSTQAGTRLSEAWTPPSRPDEHEPPRRGLRRRRTEQVPPPPRGSAPLSPPVRKQERLPMRPVPGSARPAHGATATDAADRQPSGRLAGWRLGRPAAIVIAGTMVVAIVLIVIVTTLMR